MIDEKRLLEKIDRMNDTVSLYRQDVRTVAQNLLCEISDYIKEQPKIKWIPCNERLPVTGLEDDKKYIVTIEGAEEATTLYYNHGEWTDDFENHYSVLAWMEFPEAYLESTMERIDCESCNNGYFDDYDRLHCRLEDKQKCQPDYEE